MILLAQNERCVYTYLYVVLTNCVVVSFVFLIFVPGVAGLSEIGKNNLALNLYRSLF